MFVHVALSQDKKKVVDFCKEKLPPAHQRTLHYLIDFLRELAKHEKDTRCAAKCRIFGYARLT